MTKNRFKNLPFLTSHDHFRLNSGLGNRRMPLISTSDRIFQLFVENAFICLPPNA